LKSRVLALKIYAYFCKKLVKTGVYISENKEFMERLISNKIFLMSKG
jgi:hypothetical protein